MRCWPNTAPATVRAALAALSDRAETLMRAEVENLPDGRWEAEDFLDNDGIEDTALCRSAWRWRSPATG